MTHYSFVESIDNLPNDLLQSSVIGVDTEFMREKTYFAQLCLVQVSSADDIYFADPLADSGLDAFWNETMPKTWVLHSARQDIEVISQSAERMPASIFDTQVAAGLLGLAPQIGYANLMKELFDVEMAKSHTRADWTRRPLSPELLEYAAEDVEHLLPAFELLCERLDRLGRLPWAEQDSAELLQPSLYSIDPAAAIQRLKGARNLRGKARAAAERLAVWRETEALKRDRPRQWIARDNVLMELATKRPGSMADLQNVEGMPPKLAQRAGRRLLELLAAANGDDNNYTPPSAPDEAQKSLLREMQAVVAACAADLQIAPETIASRKELAAAIATGDRETRVFSGWRRELIGNDLLDLL